jgi:hypothetical protein
VEAAVTATETRRARAAGRLPALAAALTLAAVAGCGASGDASTPSPSARLRAYLAAVEKVRLPVNDLLDRADPILSAYADHDIGPGSARRRFSELERKFAGYATAAAEVKPVPAKLRATNRAYAHTYVLEDSYLAALAAAIPERDYESLPATQNGQRRAIVAWRIRLEVLADRLGVNLPADIQQAGRGEIAPSPAGE